MVVCMLPKHETRVRFPLPAKDESSHRQMSAFVLTKGKRESDGRQQREEKSEALRRANGRWLFDCCPGQESELYYNHGE